jgi:hypothetical protein
LFGAARAAEKSGSRVKATQHYSALLALMDRADASRREVTAAKTYLRL